jgi:hypothetical protein
MTNATIKKNGAGTDGVWSAERTRAWFYGGGVNRLDWANETLGKADAYPSHVDLARWFLADDTAGRSRETFVPPAPTEADRAAAAAAKAAAEDREFDRIAAESRALDAQTAGLDPTGLDPADYAPPFGVEPYDPFFDEDHPDYLGGVPEITQRFTFDAIRTKPWDAAADERRGAWGGHADA